jgi:hypothetical protein
MIESSTVNDLFNHIFFENITVSETALMNDQDVKIKSLGNIRYLLDQIKVRLNH